MCKCIAKVNEQLIEHNTVLETTLFSQWCLLRTGKIDTAKRGKPAAVAATFCPFCGNPYPKKKESK